MFTPVRLSLSVGSLVDPVEGLTNSFNSEPLDVTEFWAPERTIRFVKTRPEPAAGVDEPVV